MKLNNKGVSLVEIIVSIALISVVLILLINLFMGVRNVYNNGKIEADYEMLKSTIIKAVGDDIDKYQLESVSYQSNIDESVSPTIINVGENYNGNKIILTFKAKRPSNPAQNIRKILSVYGPRGDNNLYYVSYVHDYGKDIPLTSNERTETVIRQIPENSIINNEDDNPKIKVENKNNLIDIEIPIRSNNDINYNINIYGLINNSEGE